MAVAFTQKELIGIGSIYHSKYDGRRAANGEIFRQSKLTAASNFFPLNSRVKVTNLKTNDTVIVKITDRMATWTEKKGRIIDLSKAAAKEINFSINQGLLKVKVEQL